MNYDAYFRCNLHKQCIQLVKRVTNITSYFIILAVCATNGKWYLFGMDMQNKLKEENKNMLQQLSIHINLINMYGKNGIVNMCE